jgi:hypothetical protein
MFLESTQALTEMSTRNISWGKGGRCVGLTTLPTLCADFLKKLGASTSWKTQGLSRAVKIGRYRLFDINGTCNVWDIVFLLICSMYSSNMSDIMLCWHVYSSNISDIMFMLTCSMYSSNMSDIMLCWHVYSSNMSDIMFMLTCSMYSSNMSDIMLCWHVYSSNISDIMFMLTCSVYNINTSDIFMLTCSTYSSNISE